MKKVYQHILTPDQCQVSIDLTTPDAESIPSHWIPVPESRMSSTGNLFQVSDAWMSANVIDFLNETDETWMVRSDSWVEEHSDRGGAGLRKSLRVRLIYRSTEENIMMLKLML